MIKNKSFALINLCIAGISCLCVCFLFMTNLQAGIIGTAGFVSVFALFFIFTRKRYIDIKKLSAYLASVYMGNRFMDIRDNKEGELSILKNDIYKVTVTLSEQSKLLKKDKEYLAQTLSNISHQLKTPLTSMFVMADLLNDPHLPEEKRNEFTEKIIGQLKRIEWLVNALLRMAKIDAGTIQFHKKPTALRELLYSAMQPLWIPAELKHQTVTIRCEDTIIVNTDKNWTAEAFVNILKNCIEHTPENGALTISCVETPLYTKVSIRDTGDGISKEDLPHIFERFYKGKNSGSESVGIGLAMAKTILMEQAADISAKSETDKGAEFTIKFFRK